MIYVAPGVAEADQAETVSASYELAFIQLREFYPHAQIVMGDVLADGGDRAAQKLNHSLYKAAYSHGVPFISTRGWAQRYNLGFEQVAGFEGAAPVASEQLNFYTKWGYSPRYW